MKRPAAGRTATGSSDGALRIWDVGTGKRLYRAAHEASPRGLAWLPDGKGVVVSSSHLTAIHAPDGATERVVLGEYERGRSAGDVAVGDGYIAGRVDETKVDLWDYQGKLLERLTLKSKIGVWSLAPCPGGILLGTGAACALRFRIRGDS